MQDHEMRMDQDLWERDTAALIDAAVDEVLGPDAVRTVRASMFDGCVVVARDPRRSGDASAGASLARALRGGRDFDPSMPSDWHLRSAAPDVARDREGEEEVAGHVFCLSRSLPAPAGYSEASA